MKVYAVRSNYRKFADLLFKDRNNATRYYRRPLGKFLLPEWEQLEVVKGVGNDGLTTSKYPVGNFADLESLKNPTIDDAARTALEKHIGAYGEFLPIQYGDETRWLFNCMNLLTALNMQTSLVTRFPIPPYRIAELKGPLYFDAVLLESEWIFFPAECPAEIFVTDKFVKVVEGHKLTGFDFHEIWDSNDKPPAQKPNDPALMTRHDLN
jgi:hypothetical protein